MVAGRTGIFGYFHHEPFRMNTLRLARLLPSIALSLASIAGSLAQCTNTSHYPNGTIIPDAGGAVTTITTCNWQTEYAEITSIVAGAAYQFTIADGSFITVHQGTYDGAVLGYGLSPLTVVAATNADLFSHWNTNSSCGTAGNCLTTTVQRFLDCIPPTVSYSTESDCTNNEFSVSVLVSDTGDASALAFAYTVNGGNLTVQSGIGLGFHTLGPFPLGAVIDLTVVHGDNSDCNVVINSITSAPCVIESCGPDIYTHCYGNSETYVVHYAGNSTYPLSLSFNSGSVSASGNDMLVIHDGLLVTDPVLFSGVGNAGNLTGVAVVSTNADHALTLTMTSNSSFSCADGGVSPEWNYTVGCLDCSPPEASAGAVITNCDLQHFTVDVDITAIGTDPNVEIANNVGVAATFASAPGTYTAGPFPLGSPVIITLVNDQNSLCNVPIGTFMNGFCAAEVICGGSPVTGTYCYQNSDHQTWLYQNTSSQPLALVFSAGSIENVAFDHLTMYDGTDNTAPILWQHALGSTENLAGLAVVSTGSAMFMEMTSDNSISCADGNISGWIWTVGCLDCTNPTATFNVIPDCLHHRYSIDVHVTSLGSSPDLRLATSWSPDTLDGVGLGSMIIGPAPVGGSVHITLLNSQNPLCRIHSPDLSFPFDSCTTIACEPLAVEYCYANADTVWFVYRSGTSLPITLAFDQGELLPNDNLLLYNGPDTTAQLVFAGNLGGQVGGLVLTSNNPGNALTLLVASDASGSCATGEASPALHWTVGCGLVGIQDQEENGPLVYPDPASTELHVRWPTSQGAIVLMEIFDMIGRSLLVDRSDTNWADGRTIDITRLEAGNYMIRIATAAASRTEHILIVR